MADPQRLELTLRKPWFGAMLKPTVVFNSRGHPAQWGTGTWQVAADAPTEVSVFLFNRLWRFGHVEIVVAPGGPGALVYTAPLLPVGPGRLVPVSR